MKTTGVTSTSFRIWLATFVPSVAAAVTAFMQNTGGSKTAVLGGAGIVSALFATLGKLWHDGHLNTATLLAAGSDVAIQLPALKSDLSKVGAFVETDLPFLKPAITSVETRVTALESKVVATVGPDVAAITAVVHQVLAGLATPPVAPVTPVTPA
jgi:hypothetical protein